MIGMKSPALLFDSIEDTIESFSMKPFQLPLDSGVHWEPGVLLLIFLIGNGEFIVVLDSASRENEGDLIIAAECMTTEKMAFMVRYTRYAEGSPSHPKPRRRA